MNLSKRFSEFRDDVQLVISSARTIADRRRQRGVIVGGCVRDLLLNMPVGDVDLMFEPPVGPLVDELAQLLEATVIAYPRFLTYTLKGKTGWKFDVVTARTETYPVPAQLPDVTPSTLEEDFCRRDFSINAMACFISGDQWGELLDPLGGRADVSAKLVRALHSRSFEDDPTRIFRAARFAGRLGFQIERQTGEWIERALMDKRPLVLSAVRRRHEFELILREKDPAPAFQLLHSWDALRFLHPVWHKLPATTFALSSPPVLEERLIEWFGHWSEEQARQMMTELSFEKATKTAVLSKLVQSRTGS